MEFSIIINWKTQYIVIPTFSKKVGYIIRLFQKKLERQ